MFLRLFVQELLEPLASQDRQEILDHRDFRDLLEVLVAWDRLVHRVRWDFQDLQVLRVSNILVNCSLLLLLVCVSFTIIGQPRNSVLIRRV